VEYFAVEIGGEEHNWNFGPYETLEELKAAAKEEFPDGFSYGKGEDIPYKADAERVLDQAHEDMADQIEDYEEDWCTNMSDGAISELTDALTAVLQKWLKDKNQRTHFTVVNHIGTWRPNGGDEIIEEDKNPEAEKTTA
jgi:hypothetical protein